MSGKKKYRSRGKVTQKLTRDGLALRDAATGEDTLIGKRSADFNLRGETGDEALSQSKTRPAGGQPDKRKQRAVCGEAETRGRQTADTANAAQSSPLQFTEVETAQLREAERAAGEPVSQDDVRHDTEHQREAETPEASRRYEHTPPQNNPDALRRPPNAKSEPPPDKRPQYQHNAEHPAEASSPADTLVPTPLQQAAPLMPPAEPTKPQLQTEKPERLDFAGGEATEAPQAIDSPLHKDKPSILRFDSAKPDAPPTNPAKRHQQAEGMTIQEAEPDNDGAPYDAITVDTSGTAPLHTDKTDAPLKPGKTGKLRFSADEAGAPPLTRNLKLNKAQKQADKAVTKLENAKAKLPAKKKLRSERVSGEETGKPGRRLYFESEVKSQAEHLKGAKPLRPVKMAGNTALAFGHRKMFRVERENVATEAAHKGEMAAEAVVRSALRHRKLAPYRKAAKLERVARKKSVNLAYQKTLADNPKLQSNVLSRAFQKRKIKKDYAKAAREAQKAAKRAQKAGSVAGSAAKSVAGAVRRHPIASIVIALIALLLFALMSLIGVFGGMGSGGLGGIAASTYLAEDAGIYAAEAAYAEMEANLQNELDTYGSLHPGYDEYSFDLDEIWHDPYVLTSILSSLHEGAWILDDVRDTLVMLFERQYILTETVTTEVRYRTETMTETDPATGVSVETETEVPYTYYICTVTLENFNLSHLPVYIMSEAALSRYALYTSTLGNRPDLFPVSLYPNASFYKEYGRYDIPLEYFGDETFAAIIAEAEKYLGYPYVWGGGSPATSFDCSGFVSYVLNQCGWDIGRLGATGLYNISAAVSAPVAKPGDLVFFTGTYDTPGMSHVGIYVGDGMMLHCGDPIGYTSIETSYWQSHFHSFGRLYN
jgi:hypothetical protein